MELGGDPKGLETHLTLKKIIIIILGIFSTILYVGPFSKNLGTTLQFYIDFIVRAFA